MENDYKLPEWPYVYGLPVSSGKIRANLIDFYVDEVLAFEPSGSGEHAFLKIQKTGENTDYVARQLARFSGVRQADIGYAGLKDRHAVTVQWFSVWLPGKPDLNWHAFETDNIKVLSATRHDRKLKRGVLVGNHFKIIISAWQGSVTEIENRLELIKQNGLPNYFGEQRFGHQGLNVIKALAMFRGKKCKREQKSLYLSASRSFLFNCLLAKRVINNTWNIGLSGDVFQFDNSQSCFQVQEVDETIPHRLASGNIHPTGVLWGKGLPDVSAEALAIEQSVISCYEEMASGLIAAGAERSRRALRINVEQLTWHWLAPDKLELRFNLPAGSYATSLLRELVQYGIND